MTHPTPTSIRTRAIHRRVLREIAAVDGGQQVADLAISAVADALAGDDGTSPFDQLLLDTLGLDATSGATVTSQVLDPAYGRATAAVLTRELDEAGTDLVDQTACDTPARREAWELSDRTIRHAAAFVAALDHEGVPLVVGLAPTRTRRWTLTVHSTPAHRHVAEAWLDALVERANGPDNPLRGCHLRASAVDFDVQLTPVPRPSTDRTELRLPDTVWDEIDTNVHTHLARVEQLQRLGLGGRRGILLHGPPGTGKTHLGRIIAAELGGDVTTIVVDQTAMTQCIEETYAAAARLAPTIVLLEDVDIVARDRGQSVDAALNGLLNALDGPLTRDAAIVTIATTNDADGIDEAARRPARIDRVVEVPLPDHDGRRLVLQRYVEALGEDADDVDVDAIALRTHGASGAELRELFRHALLTTQGPVTTDALRAAVAARDIGAPSATGTYL